MQTGVQRMDIERWQFTDEQNQAQLEAFLANNQIALWPAAVKLQRILDLPSCVADYLTMAPVNDDEMRQQFESGRLPCSLSSQPLWEPILSQLEDLVHVKKMDIPTIEQQEAGNPEKEENPLAQLGSCQPDIAAFLPFVRSASKMEK